MGGNDQRTGRIEDKIDILTTRLSSIDSTLAAQHESLKEHMRRTSMLEQDVAPIKKHVNMVQGIIALMAFIGVPMIIKYLKSIL